jgi:hypothetical protein
MGSLCTLEEKLYITICCRICIHQKSGSMAHHWHLQQVTLVHPSALWRGAYWKLHHLANRSKPAVKKNKLSFQSPNRTHDAFSLFTNVLDKAHAVIIVELRRETSMSQYNNLNWDATVELLYNYTCLTTTHFHTGDRFLQRNWGKLWDFLFSIKFHLFRNIIFFCSNNIHPLINQVLRFKCPRLKVIVNDSYTTLKNLWQYGRK